MLSDPESALSLPSPDFDNYLASSGFSRVRATSKGSRCVRTVSDTDDIFFNCIHGVYPRRVMTMFDLHASRLRLYSNENR
jgi:hypothetical protein